MGDCWKREVVSGMRGIRPVECAREGRAQAWKEKDKRRGDQTRGKRLRDQWDGRRQKDLKDRIAEGVDKASNGGNGVVEI